MNKTKIEWADYTWNPIVGCKHRCHYCYARALNDRFRFIADWEEPEMFFERLKEPGKIKKPSRIFVGSMSDIFGKWVSDEWILEIIKVAKWNPQHTFMFLTKNPNRYKQFESLFTENCLLGTTITGENINTDLDRIWQMKNLKAKKFLSIEPLMGNVGVYRMDYFDLLIVGAMTGKYAENFEPKTDWIKNIKHPNVFYKENIKKYMDK